MLQIGLHAIEGTVHDLKKKMLILKKTNSGHIEVSGCFRKKIVFDKRPTPLLLAPKKVKP